MDRRRARSVSLSPRIFVEKLDILGWKTDTQFHTSMLLLVIPHCYLLVVAHKLHSRRPQPASSPRPKLPRRPLPPSLRSATLPHLRWWRGKREVFASPTQWGRRVRANARTRRGLLAGEAGAQRRGLKTLRVAVRNRPHRRDPSSPAAPSRPRSTRPPSPTEGGGGERGRISRRALVPRYRRAAWRDPRTRAHHPANLSSA